MSHRPSPDETRLWSVVAATVRPLPGRPTLHPHGPLDPGAPAARLPAPAPPKPVAAGRTSPPTAIEPGRRRKIARGRSALEATLDLHGYGQDAAEVVLRGFLLRAYDQGLRAALVITGRGVQGSGVLRRRTPEWLAAADLRHIIAGFSESHQKHGGEGALYVALKRKPAG